MFISRANKILLLLYFALLGIEPVIVTLSPIEACLCVPFFCVPFDFWPSSAGFEPAAV